LGRPDDRPSIVRQEPSVFDIGTGEVLVLAIAALLVFGPERLPKIAAQAGRALRQVREMAAGARRDIRDQLGPEFQDLDVRDLNPRSFVRKHLFDDDLGINGDSDDDHPARRSTPGPLRDGERPPHDPDAT
jgi:sec-independent protein translocase protein TatB